MASGKAFRHATERFGVDGLHCRCAFRTRFEKLVQLRVVLAMMLGHPAAQREELIALGHVDAGGEETLFGADVEIKAAAGSLLHAAARPPGGEMRFVGALVGRKPDIAVDAHHGFVRGAHVIGRVLHHRLRNLVDKSEHGGFELALVDWFARIEPVAVVVAREAAKEGHGGRREVRGHGGNGSSIGM